MRSFFILLSSIVSFLILLIYPDIPGYEFMILFPLVYLLCYLLLINPIIKKKISIVCYIFLFYGYLRYVLTPPLISIVGGTPSAYFLTNNFESINKAIFLMLYEIIVLSVSLYFLNFGKSSNKIKDSNENNSGEVVFLKGRKFIYFFLGVISVLLVILIPEVNDSLSFLIIKTGNGNRVDENISSSIMIVRQIILTAAVMCFVTAITICKEKFHYNGKIKYFYFSLLLAFINISIIVGERRIMQVYTAFATAYFLITMFPQYKKRIIKTVVLIMGIVVGLMSVYKFFNVFLFDSYSAAIMNNNLDLETYSVLMQSYFFGPQNVAISIEIAEQGLQHFQRLLFDVFRSTMGLNFFVKNLMMTTNDVFNYYIYGKYVTSGHPISGIGYGFMYFGPLISPILSVVFLILSLKVEKMMKKTNSLEMKYIWAYVLIRLAVPFSAMPSKLNVASLTLISWGTVYFMSHLIKIITSRKYVLKKTSNSSTEIS